VLYAVEGVNFARVEGRLVVLRGAILPLAAVPGVPDVEERCQAIVGSG
jgi:hypothetical protein